MDINMDVKVLLFVIAKMFNHWEVAVVQYNRNKACVGESNS